MDANKVIQLKKVTKTYRLFERRIDRLKETFHPLNKAYHRRFNALTNVSFDVKKGEAIGIIGKNGSGKTTLLQIISGISKPTEGDVDVYEKVAALLTLGAGFNPEFTGRQNVFINAAILGLGHDEIADRFNAISDFAGIGGFIDQPVKTYSSGMYLRLAFAVTIHVEPDIFIVDEALAVGDDLFKRKCYAKIQKFIEAGNTLLFVSHDLNTVNEICGRAILLDRGEVLLDGKSKMVTNEYERYLYAAPDKVESVRNGIIALNNDPQRKKKVEGEVNHPPVSTEAEHPSSAVAKTTCAVGFKYNPEYLPELQSKTRIEYKNDDVDICDIRLSTRDGKPVNRLIMGDEYIYSYRVRFNIDAENILFGMMITNDKGIQITGRNTPDGNEKPISHVEKGDQYHVEWIFQCNLLPNQYYFNAGVSSEKDNERLFLNRIVDASVFEVKKNTEIEYIGLVDLFQHAKITKIRNE